MQSENILSSTFDLVVEAALTMYVDGIHCVAEVTSRDGWRHRPNCT